jgi:hypothetical protein
VSAREIQYTVVTILRYIHKCARLTGGDEIGIVVSRLLLLLGRVKKQKLLGGQWVT